MILGWSVPRLTNLLLESIHDVGGQHQPKQWVIPASHSASKKASEVVYPLSMISTLQLKLHNSELVHFDELIITNLGSFELNAQWKVQSSEWMSGECTFISFRQRSVNGMSSRT
jgi:hypothetical protein